MTYKIKPHWKYIFLIKIFWDNIEMFTIKDKMYNIDVMFAFFF